MVPKFLGKDPESPNVGSPSVWDEGEYYVIQGPQVTKPAEVTALLAASGKDHVPGHETLIRFPSG